EELLEQRDVVVAAAEQPRHRAELYRRQRREVVRADEEVELARVQPADRPVVNREVEDAEEVAVLRVVIDLRPLAAREDVLDVERVPAEAAGERLGLFLRRRVEVDPGQGAGVELGQTRAAVRRRRDDDVAPGAPLAADAGQARHWY